MRRSMFEQIVSILSTVEKYRKELPSYKVASFSGINYSLFLELLQLLENKGILRIVEKVKSKQVRYIYLENKGYEWLKRARTLLEEVGIECE